MDFRATWTCPGPDGLTDEHAVAFDRGRQRRVLIVPALFEEQNRTRRLLVETMRRLDAAGIDSFLPDLPGCNESPQDLARQSLHSWRQAMADAARQLGANAVLAVRGGALVLPAHLPGQVLEPVAGATLLRQLLRARVLAAREAGDHASIDALLDQGRERGLVLAGYRLAPAMIAGLESALPAHEGQRTILLAELGGGAAPWSRAEPGESAQQSTALARIVAA
ncbi:alpha/beta hydrolase family protein [Novosphingobium huizhouense]|uniref:hypothetical protein n=1 Tax=Novosphingobium huizhouense TaxID=2866625 RepID=UPI001CD883CC|nr:hypothetical protein [Novosphingobium huizhouense]